MGSFSKGKGYSKSDLCDEGHKIILYGRLYTKYETVISNVDTFVNKLNSPVYSDSGDVIMPASGESPEDIVRASVMAEDGVILGGDLNIIKTKKNMLLPEFLALSISHGKRKRELIKRAQGKSIVHLRNSDLEGVNLSIPQISEQQHIKSFFGSLDNLIALYQRKIELLKETKKVYLDGMFPQKGFNIPRYRFNEFSIPWVPIKLGDVLIERNVQIPENLDYPLMSFVQGFGVIPKSDRYDRSFLVKNNDKTYKITEYGDFIYSSNNLETGSIGFNRTGSAVISPVYSIFYSTSRLESKYIGILSTRKDFIAKMVRFRQGVIYGQWKIREFDFLNIMILIPSGKEQKEIIEIFDNFDDLVVLYQNKLETWHNIKKEYLNSMFV